MVDNFVTSTRLANKTVFANAELINTSFQQARNNVREFSKIGVSRCKEHSPGYKRLCYDRNVYCSVDSPNCKKTIKSGQGPFFFSIFDFIDIGFIIDRSILVPLYTNRRILNRGMNTWTKAVSLVSIKTANGLAVLMFFLVVIGIVFYVVSFCQV